MPEKVICSGMAMLCNAHCPNGLSHERSKEHEKTPFCGSFNCQIIRRFVSCGPIKEGNKNGIGKGKSSSDMRQPVRLQKIY